MATDLGLNNILFSEWMSKDDLIKEITESDICLGAFGSTPQSLMTVQNKIYEALAMGKAVITGRSPAVESAFIQQEEILLCERGSAESLAEAILTLHGDENLRLKIGKKGLAKFEENYTPEKIGARFLQHLKELSDITVHQR